MAPHLFQLGLVCFADCWHDCAKRKPHGEAVGVCSHVWVTQLCGEGLCPLLRAALGLA